MSVCHTMAYAHSRGVLHRDLKPANVLLGPYNETLIVDWGLAKVLGRADAPIAPVPEVAPAPTGKRKRPGPPRVLPPLGHSSSTDTVAGAAFGTPAFMSPEQAEGNLDKLGPPSDVYSLGAMLYTLLSGKPAFEYAWCEVTTLIARVKNGEFPPPRQVNPRVPRPLEAICLKAMATSPEGRYPDAEALAGEIERWLADEPVAAYREPRWARLARWGRRHRPLVTGATGLLVAAVAGLTLGIILLGRASARPRPSGRWRSASGRSPRSCRKSRSSEPRRSAAAITSIASISPTANTWTTTRRSPISTSTAAPRRLRNWEWSHVHRLGHVDLDTFVTGDPTQRFDIWSLAFGPDGKRLASGTGPWFQAQSGPTGGLVVRDVETGGRALRAARLAGPVQAVAYSPDGKSLLAATGTTGTTTGAVLTCHDAATGELRWRAEEKDVNILGLAYSPDGKTIASGCGGFNNYDGIGYVRLRHAATGIEVGDKIPGGPGGVAGVAYSPDGKLVALANRGVVDVWDVAGRSPAFQLPGHRDFVYAVTFSPDGKWIASGGWDRTIRLWDRTTGKLARTMLGHRGFVRGLAFRPDSRQLLSGSEDKSVRLWDVASGRELAAFHGHTGFVHCVAFSPDGAQAASGSLDGTIKLWPAAAPDPHVRFRNGSGWVGTVAFHPSGRRVATAHNGSIRVWDPRTGEELWRVIGPHGLLGRIGLAFPPTARCWWPRARAGPSTCGTPRRASRCAARPRVVARSSTRPSAPMARSWPPPGKTARRLAGHGHGGRDPDVPGPHRRPQRPGLQPRRQAPRHRRRGPQGQGVGRRLGQGPRHPGRACDRREGRGLLSRRPPPRLGRRAIPRHPGLRGPDLGLDVRQPPPQAGGAYEPGHRRGVLPRRPPPGHRQRRSHGQALGPRDRRGRLHPPRAHQRGRSAWPSATTASSLLREASTAPPGSGTPSPRRPSSTRSAAAPPSTSSSRSSRPSCSSPTCRAPCGPTGPWMSPSAPRPWRSPDAGARTPRPCSKSAWLTILRPSGQADLYAQAVRRLEAACELVPGDPERLVEYRRALALALYRAGRPEDALRAIDRASKAQATPIDLAVRAMANQKLGRLDAARGALDRLRSLVKSDQVARDSQAAGFLSEAEGAVGK